MGGVGKPYPGSTGGEFFNYYEEDSNKNEASGDYSSTFGYNNKNAVPKLLMCGSNNQTPGTHSSANGGLIAGYNNNVRAVTGAAICLGGDNTVYGNNQIFIGYDNNAQGSTSPKSICVGRGLMVDFQALKQKVVLGTYNADAATLTSEKNRLQTVIGGGDSTYLGHRHNAMEVYSALNGGYECCVLFPEQIALSNYTTANKAYVNAIDPPQDPANPTTDEQTLATLGSLHKLGITRQEQHYFDTLTDLNTGTGQNITTDLGLTVPDWANEIILHIKIVDSTNFDSPITRRCNVSIPIQPADISATWRGYLNIFHIAIKNSIYSTVYYAGEFYIYQNVLDLENATELKLSEATPPTISFTRSNSSFFLEGMEFKGIY